MVGSFTPRKEETHPSQKKNSPPTLGPKEPVEQFAYPVPPNERNTGYYSPHPGILVHLNLVTEGVHQEINQS